MITLNIKARREELGILQSEIARVCGVSAGTVSRWERGEISNMGRDKIAALAKILQVNPLDVMGVDSDQEEGKGVISPNFHLFSASATSAEIARRIEKLDEAQRRQLLKMIEVMFP